MREKVYVDRLFADYEDTSGLRDFKEEITVNLQERVKDFISEGMIEEAAFEKAAAELGDITAIALFVTLGVTIGWKFSWLIFLFALAIQVFMVSTIFEKKK